MIAMGMFLRATRIHRICWAGRQARITCGAGWCPALGKKAFMIRMLMMLALLATVGCSISTSSESSADSSQSSTRSSASISRSSPGGKAMYREDVRTYTAASVKSQGPVDAFEKQLGELARRSGVTNWEDDETTYVGIGEGLRDAIADPVQVSRYATHF